MSADGSSSPGAVQREGPTASRPDGASALKVTWFGSGHGPRCAPDPAFPNGMYFDASLGGPGCKVALTYPAPCVGKWLIECAICDNRVLVTAAGRSDDAHTVKIPCKTKGSA